MNDVSERVEIRSALLVTRLRDGGDPEAGETPLILDHPAVSRRHARFVRRDGRITLADEGSTNGTFVNRKRLSGPAALASGDVIEIGPFRLLFDGAGLVQLSRANHSALHVRGVARDVQRHNVGRERILQRVSLTAKPGRVMCVIGASGSGKSTLLNIMAGRLRPSEGNVALGSLDLHTHFASLKQDIAYLPQSETVHELLTVRQALRYAALLRLPRETTEQVRESAIEEAVNAVGLSKRIDAPIVSLSGGQRKRACLACEILARPSLLFLDEATSGLDEVTDREVMALLRRLAREGMTIVCVTHTLANLYDYCDDVVVLAPGGHLAFSGAVADALKHFRGGTLGDVLADLDERGAKPWEAAAAGRAQAPASDPLPSAAARPPAVHGMTAADALRQFWVLLHRNVTLLLADRRALILASLQSLVIGALLGYAFSDFGELPARLTSQRAALLLLGITSLWMGCNSASKDIVGELHVFRREHDVNLSTVTFVLSKFAVTGAFAVLQVLALLMVANVFIEAVPGGALTQLPSLLVAAICGVTLGLLISSFCNTRDQASIIVPLAVAPQLILGSGLAPLPEPALELTRFVISAYHVRTELESVAGLARGPAGSLIAPILQLIVLLGAALFVTARRTRT